MPVIHALPVHVAEADVLRRLEIATAGSMHPKIREAVGEMTGVAHELIAPAMVYEIYPVAGVGRDHVQLHNGARLGGTCLVSLLEAAREVAIAVCTIGIGLERKVEEYLGGKKTLQAVLLDSIGSAAVDGVAREANHLIDREAKTRGMDTSSPLSPGMHGWDVADQHVLLSLLPADRIGVHLTPGAMMVPQKTISMVMGIGWKMPVWCLKEGCERCAIRKRCRQRVDRGRGNGLAI